MYLREFSFLGLGTQQGQKKYGLIDSPSVALANWPHSLILQEKSIIQSWQKAQTVHTNMELQSMDWDFYRLALKHGRKALQQGFTPINWGGDHSIGIATVAAFTSLYSNGYVLWIDAHADLNTPESSLSGNFHGMPLSVLLGIGNSAPQSALPFWKTLDPRRLIYFALRDLDPYEQLLIKQLGICSLNGEEITRQGLAACLETLRAKIGENPLHVSFDIDSIDPAFAPATGVKVSGGLNPWELQQLAELLSQTPSLKSVDIVEINPTLGSFSEVQKTYNLAFDFLTQIFSHTNRRAYDTSHSATKDSFGISDAGSFSVQTENLF